MPQGTTEGDYEEEDNHEAILGEGPFMPPCRQKLPICLTLKLPDAHEN